MALVDFSPDWRPWNLGGGRRGFKVKSLRKLRMVAKIRFLGGLKAKPKAIF